MASNSGSHDLVVIGGGIHGLVTALTAAEASRSVVLLEKDRVGQQTTAAWFGILHGGLRYLQSLDIPRLRQSVRDRRWFLQNFPELIKPMPFMMPLYGRGMKRPSAFRMAFLAERFLSADRNNGVPPPAHLPPGRVLSRGEAVRQFADVAQDRLMGAAMWHEAVVPDHAALISALCEKARGFGVEIREGVSATALNTRDGDVMSVSTDGHGAGADISAQHVINAAGPWCDALARRFDPKTPSLFVPALGFNVLLQRPPLAPMGLSLTPPGQNGPMIFLYPQGDRCFAGTWYAPWQGAPDDPQPDDASIDAFLTALNLAAPTLHASRDQIASVQAGLLPASKSGSTDLAHRDAFHDHGRNGGPRGLYTIVGVKLTTARSVARKILETAGLL